MVITKIKIKVQNNWDRNIIWFYNVNEVVGLNFYQGVDHTNGVDLNFIEPCEKLFEIYKNYNERYHGVLSSKKILNKAIEAYLFANNKMY